MLLARMTKIWSSRRSNLQRLIAHSYYFIPCPQIPRCPWPRIMMNMIISKRRIKDVRWAIASSLEPNMFRAQLLLVSVPLPPPCGWPRANKCRQLFADAKLSLFIIVAAGDKKLSSQSSDSSFYSISACYSYFLRHFLHRRLYFSFLMAVHSSLRTSKRWL